MFSKIAKSFQPLNTFVKSFILDVWQGSEYASDRVFLSWNRMKNEIATCKFRLLVEFCHWKDFRNLKIKQVQGIGFHWSLQFIKFVTNHESRFIDKWGIYYW